MNSATDTIAELEALTLRVHEARTRGLEVVVVQGLGFVGAAVAAVVAGATTPNGSPRFSVIGLELDSDVGRSKIAMMNSGIPPIDAADSELVEITRRAVLENANLCATSSAEALELADVIVVDVGLDVVRYSTEPANICVDLQAFEEAIRTVGRLMSPNALVLLETTVPFGLTKKVVKRLLDEERSQRGIGEPVSLAYAYERVMPGAMYVASVRDYWRSVAGVDEQSNRRARAFLSSFIDTDRYPLCELPDPTSAELAKLLENSYRAMNIAFIYEWTLLAERVGVNLFEVIDSIRVRQGTHDNMRYPGFGVGGYCLTKDALLAQWSAIHLWGTEQRLDLTLQAVAINRRMPLHTMSLLRELAGELAGRRIALCGVSYRHDVADSRNSPAEVLVDALLEAGADVVVHDPHLRAWPERSHVAFSHDLADCVSGSDGVVLTLRHSCYQRLSAADFGRESSRRPFVVDAQNVLSDDTAKALHTAGTRLLGVGKGHWRHQGLHV